MRKIKGNKFLGTALLWLVLSGCASGPGNVEPSSGNERDADEIRTRTQRRFEEADFYKPANPDSTPTGEAALQPLLVIEISNARTSESLIEFGALPQSFQTSPRIEPSDPVLHIAESMALIGAQPHPQTAFFWFYRSLAAGAGKDADWKAQGIRLTLDPATGHPFLWETLQDDSGLNVLYASESLEARACETFGHPEPEREYCLEASLSEAPNAWIARVLGDAPIPLGPYIYLDSPSMDIVTLLCRCMPSQIEGVRRTDYYQVQSLSRPTGDTLDRLATIDNLDAKSRRQMIEFLARPPDWLETRLRWPN